MYKKALPFLAGLLLFTSFTFAQVITISEARSKTVGTSVTVTGIVTNGSELGGIRYLQDGTAGIAAYDYNELANVKRGDSIVITGDISDYNNLLEISPVNSVTIISSDHTLPDPVVLTPAQLSDNYEAQLVKIENAVFDNAGATFSAKTNYTFTASGQQGEIRINDASSPLVGKVIPSGNVTIVGPLAQYKDTYQILPRDEKDLIPGSAINIISPVTVNNITTTGFTLSWTTDTEGSTEIKYGYTPGLEEGIITAPGTGTDHTLTLSGETPAKLIYVKAFSVANEDTAWALAKPFITESESSGNIKVYFNRPVDTTVSTGVNAIWLDHAVDDTLIAYIRRARYSIDVAIYNFNNYNISNISTALNDAYSRGVRVRVVYDSNTDNSGIDELDAGIGKIASPESHYPDYGIMHNKFVIIDAKSTDPNDPIVWTGSTNFTDSQMNTDPNNVIIVQDQSLAITYTLEFEEMFGSDGAQPDPAKSKFGPAKSDNTPHELVIGGHRVECYFSPSDGTNAKILAAINSADADLSAATMLITRSEIGYAIRDRADDGVTAKVLVNDDSDPNMETVKKTLETVLGNDFKKTGESGIMHHKYLVVDNSNTTSDPLVLTGCHNWSSSAEYRNDENTLIVHDDTIANLYYQEFTERFKHGRVIVDAPKCVNDFISSKEDSTVTYDVTANDHIPGTPILTLVDGPSHGTATTDGVKMITYIPDSGFAYLDTITYKICLSENTGLCDSALMVIYSQPTGVSVITPDQVNVFPNPTAGRITVTTTAPLHKIKVYSLTGNLLQIHTQEAGNSICTLNLAPLKGMVIMEVITDKGKLRKRIMIR